MRPNRPTITFCSLMLAMIFIVGCSPSVQHYQHQSPDFDVAEFFTGDLYAVGVVQNYSGEVTRRFEADIKGRWQEGKGILDETFLFDDGEQQFRCWRLQVEGNTLTGNAEDVVGQAKGEVSGNTLNWRYVLRVPMGEGETIDIHLDDWLYLITDNHLINRTAMSKWGLPVGEVTLSIHRVKPESTQATRPDCRIAS